MNDLNLYRIFYTVATQQNISKAAQILYISQPAVSKSIKSLEVALDIKLFSRGSKGVKLTPEGTLLYMQVAKALDSLTTGEHLLDRLKHLETGELKIGVSTTLGSHFLLPLLKKFTQLYPHIKLQIANQSTNETHTLVDKGDIDLGIVSSFSYSSDNPFIPLTSIQDIFVCSPNYYKQFKQASLNDIYKKASFMFLSSNNVTRRYLESSLHTQGVTLIPDIVATNMDFLIECALADLGITSVIREFILPQLNKHLLMEIDLNLSLPKRYIGISTNPHLAPSITAHTFINFLRQQTDSYHVSFE